MPPRVWDWWTEHKLEILSSYLREFVVASKRARTTVYLDLFAGGIDNISRGQGQRIAGSPWRALDVDPPLSILRFFEQPAKAEALRQELTRYYPSRDIEVHGGDCNDTLTAVLRDLRPVNWAPTFAFIDQQSTELHWETLRQLAQHKRADKWKVELWLLFAGGLLPRGLASQDDTGLRNAAFADSVSEMFGTQQWLEMQQARDAGALTPAQLRDELCNLMRWRLENELGYRWTQVFPVVNTGGTPIYDMIFATDHPAGHKIMRHLHEKALQDQLHKRTRAKLRDRKRRDQARGVESLFDLEEVQEGMAPRLVAGKQRSEHERPWEPPRFR